MYARPIFTEIHRRILGERRFIQVLAGPRQSGKTTLARQLMESVNFPSHYASADEPMLKDRTWIEQQWEVARLQIPRETPSARAMLILDEIQKIPGWSETVKRLWDEDTFQNRQLQVVIVGSAPLLVERGLSESLAGRFEILFVTHWSYPEMRDAFGWDLDTYLYFGGYPGAAALIDDPSRWRNYILHSLIETTISRDILLLTRVDKPALLRRLFELGCSIPDKFFPFRKCWDSFRNPGIPPLWPTI